MHANDRAYVAWEAVGRIRPSPDSEVDVPELNPEKDFVAACLPGHPYDRSPPESVEGDTLELPLPPREDFKIVKVHRFHFGSGSLAEDMYRDPYNACEFMHPPLQTPVTVLDGPCSDAEGFFDACMKDGCHIPIPDDSALMFELDNPFEVGHLYDQFYPQPFLKVVSHPRTLSRRMHFAGVVRSENQFSWSVPVLEHNRWQENFSPSLKILKVKTFKRAANGQMTYMQPTSYEVNGFLCQPRQRPDYDIFTDCSLATNVHTFTPTYWNGDKDKPLQWVMFFSPSVAGASDEVYVEFTVGDAIGSIDGVLLSPIRLDFGRVATGTRVMSHVFVENTGTTDIMVDQPILRSDTPTEFELQPPAGVTFPVTLAPGDLIPLEAYAVPAGIGASEKSMIVEVEARGVVSGKVVASQMEMRYEEISGPIIVVVPDSMRFYWDPCPTERRDHRTMVVINAGHLPMTRRNPPRIEGAVPDAFQITSVHDPTVVIESGGFEDIRVEFNPGFINGAPGDYAAELVVDTDATAGSGGIFSNGETRLPLVGLYVLGQNGCQ
jgi:hypothetical protein